MAQIREAQPRDARAILEVHVAGWRTTYRGIVPQAFLDQLSVERRTLFWEEVLRDPERASYVYVAIEHGQIVGFIASGAQEHGDGTYTGEIFAIYLLEAHQGKGIGRALMSHAARRLLVAGHTAMVVGVLEKNPACRFYEALGGRLLHSEPAEIGGAMLTEAFYGWQDIRPLAETFAPG